MVVLNHFFQSAARGGVSASVSINYQLEPAASIQACTASCSLSVRRCVGVYESIPDSYITIESWYQTRSVRTCGRWIVRKTDIVFLVVVIN